MKLTLNCHGDDLTIPCRIASEYAQRGDYRDSSRKAIGVVNRATGRSFLVWGDASHVRVTESD